MNCFLITLNFIALFPQVIHTDIFLSMDSLISSVRYKELVYKHAREYVQNNEIRENQVESFIKTTDAWLAEEREAARSWSEDDYSFVSHPIVALQVIRLWLKLQESVEPNLFPAVGLPQLDQSDYAGALDALVRLQWTYDVDTADMAAGVVANISAAHALGYQDQFELAQAWMSVDQGVALSWFQLTTAEQFAALATRKQYHVHLMNIYTQAGKYGEALKNAARAKYFDPSDYKIQQEISKIKYTQRKDRYTQDRVFWKQHKPDLYRTYESLCRGDNITNDIRVTPDLVCVFRPRLLPYDVYKEEIHSMSPRVSLIYDVLSNEEANLLINRARPKLKRAQIGIHKSEVSGTRVGKVAWLRDTDPLALRLSRRIDQISGLSTRQTDIRSHAEPFQLNNYGLGGHYISHTDFTGVPGPKDNVTPSLQDTGDRMATFMFYIATDCLRVPACDNDCPTTLQRPNNALDVLAKFLGRWRVVGRSLELNVKNAAAFWYNFDLAGESGDPRTLHAGCPVLVGQKWIANKWMRQRGQEFRRPCGLSKDQVDPIHKVMRNYA